MERIKTYWPDVLVVVLFAVISFAYFFPADLDGRILYRHDASAGRGAGQEVSEYHERTGKVSRWTNATFSGQRTFPLPILKAYHLWLPENVWYVFAYLLGFYILLRAFDFRWHLAALGAIVWAFSSYFFIIIAAGHIWKVMALAYLPPLIAGLVWAYRGKLLRGFCVTALFSAFEIDANHVQMTYYYLFVIAAMVIAYGVDAVRRGQWKGFLRATGVCAAGALIGVLLNLSNLYHTWQYAQESMRGKSELVKKNVTNQTSSGLDRDYITQWSYGIDETWTLLVPNAKGGASVPLAANAKAMEKADPNFMQIYQQMGQYWGDQPGTSGPVYVGAFVLMLFVLGLFIVKGPMKWALLGATVLSILLSWGHNFMPFTDFFLDYVPMYSKFRTVASILVIAEFTIPLLAMLALKRLVDEPDLMGKQMRWVYVSFGLTGGIALLFALMPTVFFSDFISAAELEALKGIPADYLAPLESNLRSIREGIFVADCWRSFWIIAIGMALLLLYRYRKLKAEYMVGAMVLLCLIDMWQVNKRYLNDGMFVEKSVREQAQPMTETDRLILRDKDLDYRVLNLASNTFNENETSYYHKSIGGYHAAKLRRYQDLIDNYIAPEMQQLMSALAKAGGDMTKVKGDSIFPVLNMLNAKYFIVPLQNNKTVPIQNPYVLGNAWFVDKLNYVNNANQELEALGKLNLRHEAVADARFKTVLGEATPQDSTSVVKLTAYAPNQLTYEVKSATGGVMVFSEIYYPEWTATVDGKPVEIGRADYVLRALKVDKGQHQVVLTFDPKSVKQTETVAYAAYVVLLLVVLFGLYAEWKRKQKA